jgi:general L-amino acid transport system substrate-binding protein
MTIRIGSRVAMVAVAVALVASACTREEGGEVAQPTGGGAAQSPPGGQETEGSLLDEVKARGTLRCGVNQTVPGFGFLNPTSGEIEGFDIDFCKAIAAAVLGDATAFELVPVTADERFNALRAGQFDVLVRNTTWTSSRDGSEGVSFAHVNFYDGQGMMVRSDAGFSDVAGMTGAPAVCVTAGTTTELNLADYFQQLGLEFEPVVFEENPQLQEAFIQGRCDGWTSDKSQLAGIRSQWPEEEGGPESLTILPDIMSKEPLAPAVLDGDTAWYDAVNWVVNGVILAEELEVESGNVDQMASSPPNPQTANLLGVPFEAGAAPFDPGLGLEPTFMQTVLEAVGNYGEIYDRHVGPASPLQLERGLNALWNADPPGLQYAAPFR